MAMISDKLNKIITAVFGKDVRQALHDGLDAVNKETEETSARQQQLEGTFDQLIINAGNSNAEIVAGRVKQDGTSYETIGKRLDASDSQLADITNDLGSVIQEIVDARNGVEQHPTLKHRLNHIDDKIQIFKSEKLNVLELGIVGDGTDCTNDLNTIFNMNVETIFIPSGTYVISDTINISSYSKKIVGSENTIFKINTTGAKNLFEINVNVFFENIIIDYDNNDCLTCLSYSRDLGEIKLKNLTIKNINSTTATPTFLIYGRAKGCIFDFDNIKLLNNKKEDFGDSSLFEGIYLTSEGIVEFWEGGTLDNLYIEDFFRYKDNNITGGISNAIYIAGNSENGCSYCNITINNLIAKNFGKRLLKSQVSNLNVNNVNATTNNIYTLSCLSFQDHDSIRTTNCSARDIVIRGTMEYGIACSCDDVTIINADIDIDKNNMNTAIGIAGDNITVENSKLKAYHVIRNTRNLELLRGDIMNFKIQKSIITPKYDNGYGFNFEYTTIEKMNGITIQDCTIDIQDTNSPAMKISYKLDNKHSNINISNVTILSKSDSSKASVEPIRFTYTDIIRIYNLKFIDTGIQEMYRAITFVRCSDIMLDGVVLGFAANNSSLSFSNSRSVVIRNVIANENSLWNISNTDTDMNLDVNNNVLKKITLNDNYAKENTKYSNSYTKGSTSLRPKEPLEGQTYFDTTLKIPIWWNGVNWINSSGNIV